MEELKRIYNDEFLEEWNRAYNNWYGKFSLRAKEPVRQYWDGYSEVHFSDPQTDFWCHIWQGPHCVFGRTELIPNVTIVTGANCSPMFFTPKEIVEKFDFSNRNPFTGKWEAPSTTYGKALQRLKEQIQHNALMS